MSQRWPLYIGPQFTYFFIADWYKLSQMPTINLQMFTIWLFETTEKKQIFSYALHSPWKYTQQLAMCKVSPRP